MQRIDYLPYLQICNIYLCFENISMYSSVNCIVYICVYGSFRQALFNINRRKSDPSSEYVLSRSTFNPDDTTILKTSRSPSLMPLSILK